MDDQLLPEAVTTGVFLRSEALAAGYRDRDIAAFVRRDVWHRVRRGAYIGSVVWHALDDEQRHAVLARAVLRQAKTEVVLSHVSALPEYDAAVWDIPLDTVHVTRTDRTAGRHERGVHQHQGRLLAGDIEVRNGVRVTSATRAAIDVTTMAGVEQSLVAIDALLHAGHTTPQQLRERYGPMSHCPNTLRTDLVLRLADGRSESPGESRSRYLCWRHGLPAPTPQQPVLDRSGRPVAYVDLGWPALRSFLEFDGQVKYAALLREGESASDVVVREKRREDLIRELTGWRCIRLVWADLNRPEHTAARIRALLFDVPRAA